jgi:hypothetical protein
MYNGYMAIGGVDAVGTTEILNAERTYQYVRRMLPGLTIEDVYEARDLPALLGHGAYRTPALDDAPWVEGEEPASAGFLGLYPLSISGADDSTFSSPVTELNVVGGMPGVGRYGGREIRVRALMIAEGDESLEVGMSWLRNVLSDASCRGAAYGCVGEALTMLVAAPETCEEALVDPWDFSQGPHECIAPLMRQFYRTVALQGVRTVREYAPRCGAIREVEFILYAGVPHPFRLPEFIGTSQGRPLEQVVNLVYDPSMTTLTDITDGPFATSEVDTSWSAVGDTSLRIDPIPGASTVRTNLAWTPAPYSTVGAWWTAARNTLTRDVTVERRPGVPSWRLERTEATATQGYLISSGSTGDRIPVTEGQPITISAYVNPAVEGIGNRALLLGYNASNALVGVIVSGTSTDYPAGEWSRVSASGIVPAGITSVRAQIDVAPSSASAVGEFCYIADVLVEIAGTVGTFFDGSLADTAETDYAWTGTANASPSTATSVGAPASNRTYVDLDAASTYSYNMSPSAEYYISGVFRQTAPQTNPSAEARRIEVRYTTADGGVGQILSDPAPNMTGQHLVAMHFTLPMNAATATIRLHSGAMVSSWWDAMILTQGPEERDYFDGNTPDVGGWVYEWGEAENASPSIAWFNPAPPFPIDNVECNPQAETIILRRNLAPIPGPASPAGWGNYDGFPATVSRVPDDTRRTGGSAVQAVRTYLSPSNFMARIRDVGYARNSGAIPARSGVTYTASVYVKTSVNARARIDMSLHNAAGTWRAGRQGAWVNTTANVWARVSVALTGSATDINQLRLSAHSARRTGNAAAADVTRFTDLLVESVNEVGAFFDGSLPDTTELTYSWEGEPFESTSVVTEVITTDPLLDPDCVFVPLPPQPPVVEVDCIETPGTWTRYALPISADEVPLWGATLPRVVLETTLTAARQVRIRFYPDPFGVGVEGLEECAYEGEFILSYMPANTVLVIDAVHRTALASVGESDPASALHLLHGSNGMPYEWSELNCDRPYVMTVDVAPEAQDLSVSLYLSGRE